MDVLDENNLASFYEKIGKYDVLINAATGGGRALGPFMNMNLEGYRNSFAETLGYTNTVKIRLKSIK